MLLSLLSKRVKVHLANGTETYVVDICEQDTILSIKQKLSTMNGMPVHRQILYLYGAKNGIPLDDFMRFLEQDRNTFISLGLLANTAGTGVWACETGGQIRSTPTLTADGARVLVGSFDNHLHCVDVRTGAKVWAYKTGDGIGTSTPTLTADGARVLVGSLDKYLHCVDVRTGAEVWTYKTGGWIVSTPTLTADGARVLVSSHDNHLHCVDVSTGAKVWAYETGGAISSTPTLTADGARVIVGSSDNHLHCVSIF